MKTMAENDASVKEMEVMRKASCSRRCFPLV